jgi:hypothetical protein
MLALEMLITPGEGVLEAFLSDMPELALTH